TPMLDRNSVVVRSAQQVCVDLEEETVILNAQSGIYYGLDHVGTRVWELLARPVPIGEVMRTVLEEYDVDPERLETDLCQLLDELIAKGLVERRP
ncbi:MAG: PqqD family protein, partial [Spirochaetales bacterium]|nr:PqqD family protein [Spirochaetales bacterium]